MDSKTRPLRGGVLYLYGEFWRLARGSRHKLLAACSLLIGAQVILLAAPLATAKAINALQLNGAAGAREASLWLMLVLGLAVGSWLLHGPGRILERNVSLGIRRRLSTSLIERLMHLPLAWHETHQSGATAHRIQQSSHALTGFAQSQYVYLNSAVRLIGPTVALWLIEPVVGAAAVAGFVLICGSAVRFDRAMIRLAHQENQAERQYSASLVETLGNTTTLFALRQASGVVARMEKKLLAIFEPLRRSILINEWKWCTVDLSTRALSCALVALFVWRTGSGQALLLGSLYLVWEYAVQAGGVLAAVAQHFQTFARQSADYSSADEILEAPSGTISAHATPAEHPGVWHRLDIRDLSFHHAKGRLNAPALDCISFSLERGKRYAIIGESGSGKSTLLRVLAGLYPAEQGAFARDGNVPIASAAEMTRFLRCVSTLLPQDAEVFAGTLAENLSLCESVKGPPKPEHFAEALHTACADNFVDASPQGLQESIAERAANWSGGQRSRIALARCILAARGSSLVLLDEPTANLDATSEAQVYGRLFSMFADACVISSVHRLHLLEHFDEVLVLEGGRVVAQGTPSDLAETSRQFGQLLSAQRRLMPDREFAAA